MSVDYEHVRVETDYDYDHLQQPETWNDAKKKSNKVKNLSILLTFTCIGFIGAIIAIICMLVLEITVNDLNPFNSNDNNNNNNMKDYIIDGAAWHTIFYRMTNQSGIDAAKTFCFELKNITLNDNNAFPATSVHCGIQNSIEQVSFGPHGTTQNNTERSLEYGFAFTFKSVTLKNIVTQNNKIYSNFRVEMDKYRDQTSFSQQNYKGIWIFDWAHGITNRTNMRAYNATSYVKMNSTWHFCYFRFKRDSYTYHAIPTIIDNYRDLENTIVSPNNSSKKLVNLFSFGIQNNVENLSFGPHDNIMFNRSTEYGHVSSYDTFNEKEFMVGANHVERPVYDIHHDLFKAMIGQLHQNGSGVFDGAFFGSPVKNVSDLEGVFVFDFTDDIKV
eukprot:216721_1